MANPWDNDPIVRSRKTDPRIDEREQAETRYRNLTGDANPLAQPVILPGEEGYAGEGQYLPEADVVVRGNMPWSNDLQVTPGSEAIRANSNPAGAYAQSAAEQLPWVDEAAAWTVSKLTGEPLDYVRETQRMGMQIDREEQPLARNLGGVSGFAAGLAAPGGAYVQGGRLASGASRAAIVMARRQAALRAAGVTGAYGAAYGSGAADDGATNRLVGGVGGGVTGAVGGGVVQRYAPAVVDAVGSFAGRLGSIVNPSGRVRARGNVTPEMSAASRLSEFVTPEALTERQRLIDLGLQPSAMDVLGGTAERLVRTAAGPAGPGAEMAVQGAAQRQANLRPEVMSVTRGLSDDPRSAEAVREGLLETRGRLADEMYPEAYATPVEVTDDLLAAISDEPGRAALRRARAAAVARQDANQVAEIDGLLRSSGTRLDMSPEAIARRAEAEGFTYEAFHGTPAGVPIESFAPSTTGTYGPGIYTARSPSTASQYAGPDGAVYPVRVRLANPLEASAVRNPVGNMTDAEIASLLSEQGRGGVLARFPDDEWYVPSSPDDIRSRFDPFTPEGYTPPPDSVSAGTIDRVRIAMRGRAQAMQQRPDTRDIAGGLFGREAQIDTALEGVEALAPARAQYRALSGAADVIDNRPDIFSTDPQDFRSWVDTLSPEARDAAIIGVRQDILDTLGRQRSAGSSSLDSLTQAQYSRDNLSALLGPEEAQRYLDSVAARVQGAQRAQRVSPNTNSQTFGRGMDEETLGVAERLGAVTDAATGVMGNLGGIARTVDRIRARATMSPEERAAIVQMGFGSADELERIVMLADQARASRRPPPREVRAWITSATSRLGANNPAVRELQQLLLPAVSPAQETETQP